MITTLIVDAATGAPAPRVPVELDLFISGHGWHQVGYGMTDNGGGVEDFGEPSEAGIYRLMFDIASYRPEAFFPSISVTFEIEKVEPEINLQLVLSPFGYSVHRGY
jgi:5-hydroxyisourate hydrolase